jgi:hypothetical protein
MDGERVARLRAALYSTGWWQGAEVLGDAVRRTARPGGLLVVGTPDVEPWHLAAHLDDEARYSDLPQLRPTLVRWKPPPDAPAHLAVTLARLESAGRGETVFLVSPDVAPDALLERLDDARRTGATVLSLDGGDPRLEGLAHERMSITESGLLAPAGYRGVEGFDLAQHLVSSASGRPVTAKAEWRDRLLAKLSR